MYSSLFLSCVCVWSPMIPAHENGVSLTQFPDHPPGVTHPLGQDTTAVVSRPPMCKQTRTLGPVGTLERSVGSISSPSCP